MNNMKYDLIIAGSGPAGLSAAVYAARAELSTIVIEKAPMSGGQIINTYEIDNYLGLPGISGFELAQKFREHCDKLYVKFIEGEIMKCSLDGDNKYITLDNGETYEGASLMIATGAESRKLSVKGEREFSGIGVSYCATCDGAFFKGKVTAVIGGGDTAVEDAIFLARLCKKVYIIHRRDEFRAAKSLVSKLELLDNVEIVLNSIIEEIEGDSSVTGIKVKNITDNTNQHIETDGVFIAVGSKPNSEVFQGIVSMDQGGYIIADESCRTSNEGIFAAGDVRTKNLRQVITAASDGANAVYSVEQYLNQI